MRESSSDDNGVQLTVAVYASVGLLLSCTSLLSLVGSLTVVRLATGKLKSRRHTIYNTLVTALSAGDILSSLNCLFLPYAPPRDTPSAFWAVGNRTTCAASGFLLLWGILWVAVHNCLLALHFYLTVCGGARRRVTMQRIPKWAYRTAWILLAIGLPTGFCTVAATSRALHFTFNQHSCALERYPPGCTPGVDCQYGENAKALGDVLALLVVLLTLPGLIGTCLVYRAIRKQFQVVHRNGFASTLTNAQQERRKQSAWQAILYYCAYLNTLIWPSLLAIFAPYADHAIPNFEARRSTSSTVLLYGMALFFPLQGAVNAAIYIRPATVAWRRAHPQASWMWIVYQASTSTDEPSRQPRTAAGGGGPNHQSRWFTTLPNNGRQQHEKPHSNPDANDNKRASNTKTDETTSSDAVADDTNALIANDLSSVEASKTVDETTTAGNDKEDNNNDS